MFRNFILGEFSNSAFLNFGNFIIQDFYIPRIFCRPYRIYFWKSWIPNLGWGKRGKKNPWSKIKVKRGDKSLSYREMFRAFRISGHGWKFITQEPMERVRDKNSLLSPASPLSWLFPCWRLYEVQRVWSMSCNHIIRRHRFITSLPALCNTSGSRCFDVIFLPPSNLRDKYCITHPQSSFVSF